MKLPLLFLLACSSPPVQKPPVIPGPVDPPATATCPDPGEWKFPASFKQAGEVVHLKVIAARPGPTTGSSRCVGLDLEVVDAFRGSAKAGDRVTVAIQQSMIEHYTSRPAGAWWIVEQTLEPGSEYVALCEAGKLADVLVNRCSIMPAAPHLANLVLLRDAEKLDGPTLLARFRATCSIADELATQYIWETLGELSLKDVPLYDALLSIVLEPACSRTARAVMLDNAYSLATMHESPAHVVRVVRAMFRLLAMPEAADLHDNLVGTWLPNALGLEGGLGKLKPTDVFSGDPAGRTAATKTLAAYKGDATKLRVWIK